MKPYNKQSGNVFPLLLIGLAILGIVLATSLTELPQIFKSRADFIPTPTTMPPLTQDGVSATCDATWKVTLKWQEIKGSTNYTLRLNHYPPHWNPDYTGFDSETPTTFSTEIQGDRALEAGNTTSKVVNVGDGLFLGGTVTATNGQIQIIPEFVCPNKYEYCTQSVVVACAPDNAVFCRQFANPCKVPPGWIEARAPTIMPDRDSTKNSSEEGKVCIQVITTACEASNPANCRDFPTPCNIPSGWVKK